MLLLLAIQSTRLELPGGRHGQALLSRRASTGALEVRARRSCFPAPGKPGGRPGLRRRLRVLAQRPCLSIRKFAETAKLTRGAAALPAHVGWRTAARSILANPARTRVAARSAMVGVRQQVRAYAVAIAILGMLWTRAWTGAAWRVAIPALRVYACLRAVRGRGGVGDTSAAVRVADAKLEGVRRLGWLDARAGLSLRPTAASSRKEQNQGHRTNWEDPNHVCSRARSGLAPESRPESQCARGTDAH